MKQRHTVADLYRETFFSGYQVSVAAVQPNFSNRLITSYGHAQMEEPPAKRC